MNRTATKIFVTVVEPYLKRRRRTGSIRDMPEYDRWRLEWLCQWDPMDKRYEDVGTGRTGSNWRLSTEASDVLRDGEKS